MMASIRTVLKVLGAAFALAACGSPPAQAQTQTWQVATTSDGFQIASISTGGPTGPKRGLALTCQGRVPQLVIPAARIGTKPRANLELTGTAGGSPVTVPMIWNPQGGAWVASLGDRAALDLLAGASSSVSMTLNGTALGTIPLTGSSNAIRTALVGCYVPVAAPVAAAGGTGGSRTAPSLPLRFGTYVRAGKRCGAGYSAQVFIDARNGGAGDAFMAGSSIVSLRKTGTNTYVARETRNDEADTPFTATYTITDREHFTVRAQGEAAKSYSYCPLESLPLDQQQWPEGDHKEVSFLPIKPGYYLGTFEGDTKCAYCSYHLFRNDGIATVYTGFAGPNSRQVLRQPRILQTGALTYSVMKGRDNDEVLHLFEITSPTSFTEEDGESIIIFRSIDPAKIPARFMPRF
jgi:hypothetical protein